MTAVPVAAVAVHPDCVAAAEAAARLLESLGHAVEASHPKAMDDPDYTGHFITFWAAGAAWSLDYWSRRTGDDRHRRRRRAAHLGPRRDGTGRQRGRLAHGARVAAG